MSMMGMTVENQMGNPQVYEHMDDKEYIDVLRRALDEERKTVWKLKAQLVKKRPVGYWKVYNGKRGATCSNCRHTYYDVYDMENSDNYCRHCGAEMNGLRCCQDGE